MSKMVSRWTSNTQGREIQGYMDSKGVIKYSLIKLGRNYGVITDEEKNDMIASGIFTEVFNDEAEAKEDFEIFGFLI